jgi:DNA (cytosine-5)-methyltransferase 1
VTGRREVYYNEWEPYPAAWLRNLMAAGLIPVGDVDERSITDVQPDDLRGYTACHFFAGIGGWPYALQLAGWPADRPVWTGSCPCQPFSGAGKAHGLGDERHLWPAFHRLIAECRPPTIVGEQVASKAGRYWLAGVRDDLEGLGYAVGAADLCAASVGAPHIRQRLWWVADAASDRTREQRPDAAESCQDRSQVGILGPGSTLGAVADTDGGEPGDRDLQRGGEYRQQPEDGGLSLGVEYPDRERQQGNREAPGSDPSQSQQPISRHAARWLGDPEGRGQRECGDAAQSGSGGHVVGPSWAGSEWLPCRDGKVRRLEPGLEPLVDGLPGRVGQLRAYGNAIVPQVAAEFVKAYLGCRP